MSTKIIMPQLGESVVEGTVNRWLKREGDTVAEYEPLVEISTDKVDTEIPSPASGVVLKIFVPEGTTVERGVLLALIGQPGEAIDSHPTPNAAVHGNGKAATTHSTSPLPTPHQTTEYTGHMTPVVARMVSEHKLDLTRIKGTGRDGRVTKKDIEAYLESVPKSPTTDSPELPIAAKTELAAWEQPITGDLFKPTVDYGALPTEPTKPSAPAPSHGELVPLNAMRRSIAEHMVRSKLHTSPHVTTVFEVDMSVVKQHRAANKDSFAKLGVNLTLTAYFASATVAALQANPYINAQFTDKGIYLHHEIHLGIAVAMGDNPADNNGLIVPVIKNAQDLNLMGMARAVNDISERARGKHLKPDEVQGGTFTISNHGVSGSLFATPIINQPQVGILGVGMVEQRVKVINDALAIRTCVYLSLTFDHRVADGASADAFMSTLKDTLETWS